jgi:hypothetical protein
MTQHLGMLALQAQLQTVCVQLAMCQSARETLRLAARRWARQGCSVGAPAEVRELLDCGQLQVCLLHLLAVPASLNTGSHHASQHACMHV